MPEILTTSFKSDSTRLFIDSLASDAYYLVVSSIGTFDPADTLYSKNQFLEKILFGKRVNPNDIHYAIKYYPWQVGNTYTEYDDKVDLTGQNFYAVVGPNDNDTGDYRVYKCLRNNNNGVTSNPPNYDAAVINQRYETADGYVWKYMYRLTSLQFEAYAAVGYIPILGLLDSDPVPTDKGSISDIVVDNRDDNQGYQVVTGSLIDSADVTGIMNIDPGAGWSPRDDYYSGQFLYSTNPNGVSHIFEVFDYSYEPNTGVATVRVGQELVSGDADPVTAGVTTNASIRIVPKVLIQGDGISTTNPNYTAVGVPNIVDGRIDSVDLLEPGIGYSNAIVTVVDPQFDFDPDDPNSTVVRASLRARISPPGGHGFNIIDELRCRNFSMYAYITADDNTQIGDSNTYGAVGLIRNPNFNIANPVIFDNRIAITTSDIGNVTTNATLTQVNADNDVVFSGFVHEVDVTTNTFYLCEYMGPYRNNSATGQGDVSLDLTLPLRNETGQTITINSPVASNVTMSPYTQRSGEVYFMENFFPLPRTDNSREEFKFVLEY
jgi:hypothetical protein